MVRVVPFGPDLEGGLKELVRAVVVERWGGAAVVEYAEPVAYGGEDEAVNELSLSEGDRVEFLKVRGDKGWQAAEVIKTSSGSSQRAPQLTECPHCGKSLVEVDEHEEMV